MNKTIIVSIIAAIAGSIVCIWITQSLPLTLSIPIHSLLLFILLYLITQYQLTHMKKSNITSIYQHLKKLLPDHYLHQHAHSNQDIIQLIDAIEDERRKEQEKFKNLDSYRKEYLGNVSHELKTPLFNVQGYVSTLLDGAYEDEQLLIEYLKKADKNIERMMSIIDDLETISQLESGAMILDYETFDIEQVIQEVFEQMELSAQKKNIQFHLIKDNEYYYLVYADKFRIRQVLINLLSNSIKYGKENGHTTVYLKKSDDNKVIVTVSDDGIGIEEKHLPRIFERFYRVDKGRSREQGGTGLGLAIVKHIIEAHKQSISVKSQVGKGTSFTFSLETK